MSDVKPEFQEYMRDICWLEYEQWIKVKGLEDTEEILNPFGFAFARAVKHLAGGPDLQAASALMEAVAAEIDGWFPDDPKPTIQNDLRMLAEKLRTRFHLDKFVPDANGGHLEPWSA